MMCSKSPTEELMKTPPIVVASSLRIVILSLVLATLITPPAKSRQIADARQLFDGAMLPDVEVRTLESSDKLFPVHEVKRGGSIHMLPPAKTPMKNVRFESNGKKYDLFDYLALNRVAGLLILKNGEIAFEDYELGAEPKTRWSSFSMAKSASSTLIGAALADGSITSLDDPVTKYVPALGGSAYEGVTVRNVIQMASGVKWDETYTDPASDRRKLLDVQLAQKPGSVIAFMNKLGRAGAPGTIWNYNTGETAVVGAVLEGATHKPLATYLTEKIWSRWGMENDATWWLESPDGMGWGGSGISATLRDYGRIGLFVLADGVIDGKRTVPNGWFEEAGSPKVIGGKMVDYGYLWWVPKGDPSLSGSVEAIGIFGQHLYINRRTNVVIVVLSARPKPTGSDVIKDETFFAAVTKALN
jgi:CubicO group peptidase (beta-lactamase class C family)